MNQIRNNSRKYMVKNKIANFEKISYVQFQSDYINIFGQGKTINMDSVRKIYDSIKIPDRKTKYSAGHDISIPYEITLSSNDKMLIPTGIRCKMDENYVMLIVPRSSMGIKHGLRLSNTIAVIDADYYNAENEGHILLSIRNEGNNPIKFKPGDCVCQAVFVPYGVADQDIIETERTGGIGSTSE